MPKPANHQTKKRSPGPSPQGSGPSFLAVARVRRPFGVQGELLLAILTEFPRQLIQAERLYVGANHQAHTVISLRRHGQDMLLRLEGISDRDRAETMRGEAVFTRTDDLPPLPPGVFYLHQIEGLEVITEEGEKLGRVKEILKTGANDVYVVEGVKGEILLPAIPQVIREVQLEKGRMVVRMMEGLI
jgi:16S rRNA processing protein RimM